MILNNADNIMLGAAEVDRVYCGSVLVWERNSSPLPEGYTQLNYIQSSGAQYIKTGINPGGSDVKVQLKTAFTANGEQFLLCGYPPYGSLYSGYGLYFGQDSSNKLFIRISHSGGGDADLFTPGNITVSPNDDYTVEINAASGALTGSINDVIFSESIRNSPDLAFGLFATGFDSAGIRAYASAKMYFCKIWIGGTLSLNLIPCSRDADSKIGMYDTVSGSFLINGGSGADFTGG